MSARETARAAWGAAIPDWIETLARECDLTSQNQVARRLGRSASLVSNVLRNKYALYHVMTKDRPFQMFPNPRRNPFATDLAGILFDLGSNSYFASITLRKIS